MTKPWHLIVSPLFLLAGFGCILYREEVARWNPHRSFDDDESNSQGAPRLLKSTAAALWGSMFLLMGLIEIGQALWPLFSSTLAKITLAALRLEFIGAFVACFLILILLIF